MKKYKYLFFDVDDTLLAFAPAEEAALRKLFCQYGFGWFTEDKLKRYKIINRRWWLALERGEVTREQLLPGRFREFFLSEGLSAEKAAEFNEDFQQELGNTIVFCDDSKTLLTLLRKSFVLAAVTNGTAKAQYHKLSASGLLELFDYLFISEEVGYEKPNPAFFRIVSEKVGVQNASDVLLIGDSLTGDIAGGLAAGYDTCWYDSAHEGNATSVHPKYVIEDLRHIFCLPGIAGVIGDRE